MISLSNTQTFFVPGKGNDELAEQAYQKFVSANKAVKADLRIMGLIWRHNGMNMECEVGRPLPEYYQTGEEPVLAVLDCGNLYVVCTQSRGGDCGYPVYVGKSDCSQISYFS